MKLSKKRYLWILIIFIPLVFLIWAVFPRPDPLLDCEDVTLKLIHEHWTSGDTYKRRLVINCVLGGYWEGSKLVRVEPTRSFHGNFSFNESPLATMNREEVVELLGEPDESASQSFYYDLGYEPEAPINKIHFGFGIYPQYLWIGFDEHSEKVSSISISQ